MEVCLVTMPFACVERPSIALGLLKSALEEAGLDTACLYPNLAFAERIGIDAYNVFQFTKAEDLIGEWMFSDALYGPNRPEDDYLDWVTGRMPRLKDPKGFKKILRRVRGRTSDFVDETASRVLDRRPRIVGCTSTFQQHVASLALLRRIKERAPDTTTMMGGANCEGPMGEATHRNFPWVDYVVSGEADELIGELCRGIVDSEPGEPYRSPADAVFSPAHRLNGQTVAIGRGMVTDMDRLPLPEYDEFFEALEDTDYSERVRVGLPIEGSRGCWWGAIRHCTFCGLNGNGMASRAKTTTRVLSELDAMFERHGLRNFEMVDNILTIDHLRTLLPELRSRPDKYSLFFETKANLHRREVELLADAGVRWIQPGIESLHTEILKLMRKGSQAWKNVQLLKWSKELGVRLTWSIIYGFPGEKDSWHAEVAEWVPWLFHLQPPECIAPVRFDRFSPYHASPADWGLDLEPMRSYRSVYPLEERELEDLAYYFEGSSSATQAPDGDGLLKLKRHVRNWKAAHALKLLKPDLTFVDDGRRLSVSDTRHISAGAHQEFHGLEREVLLACEEAPVERVLPGKLSCEPAPHDELADAVSDLIGKKLLLRVDGRLIFLAIRHPSREIESKLSFPGGVTIPARMMQS